MPDIIHDKCDVLVIGGGASGSFAAIRAKEFNLDVLLVDKSYFGRSGCAALASGALRVFFPGEDVAANIRVRGDLINQKIAIEALHEYLNVYKRLEECGVPFVKEGGELWRGESPSGGLDTGLLGGGPAMMMAVRREALKRGVRVMNRVMITNILTSDGKLPTSGRAVGAIGFNVRTGQIHVFQARSVVMCAGGFGFPYAKLGKPLSGMPTYLSGDGIAAELRAGAVMGNMVQGTGANFHASEFQTAPGLEHFSAQGAKWINRDGEVLAEKYGEAEKLSSRRASLNAAMFAEVKEGRGPVSLDVRHFTPDQFRFLWNVIPIILSNYEKAGYRLSKDVVPYMAVANGTEGYNALAGAAVDRESKTSIPGLYAAGSSSDAMNIRMNLALPECFVTGLWAGESAAKFALEKKSNNDNKGSEEEPSVDQVRELADAIGKPLAVREGVSFEEAHDKLTQILVALNRIPNDAVNRSALEGITDFCKNYSEKIIAKDPHQLAKVHGLKNYSLVMAAVLSCMSHRKESRGSILNEDYPMTDNDDWLNWTRCRMKNFCEFEIWDTPIPEDTFVFRTPKKGKRMNSILRAMRSQ